MTVTRNVLISKMEYEKKATLFSFLRLRRKRALKPENAESAVNRKGNKSIDKYQFRYRRRWI